MRTIAIAAAALMLLSACGGSGSGIPSAPASRSDSARKPTLVLRIEIPKRKHRRTRARYVSPSTQGMTIFFNGPSPITETFGLTPGSPGCSPESSGTLCTERIDLLPCPSAAACYSGTVVTYDSIACAGTACTIPPGSHQLSANQDVAFSLVAGQANVLSLTLDGIVASIAIVPAPTSRLEGSAAYGFNLPKCTTSPQSVDVVGLDADGNEIVGPGAPTSPTLKSDDTKHLAVATPAPSTPNTFALVPPSKLTAATIPQAGSFVIINAGVTPLPGSGASSTIKVFTPVVFGSDICGVITEYSPPTSGSAPEGIAQGPDGAMWFAESATNKIGRVTTDGTFSETTIPTSGSAPQGITAGQDGAMWFTECLGNKIGRIDMGQRITNEYAIPTAGSFPDGITAGPLGIAFWFAEEHAGKIGKVTTAGVVTETPTLTGSSEPIEIATGPDGAFWFTEYASAVNSIGRITSGGVMTAEYGTPTSGSGPTGITSGPDGAMWFTESCVDRIGRITTDGSEIADYPLNVGAHPYDIVTGPDNALYFTEDGLDKIGRIMTTGTVTNEYAVPTSSSVPWNIAVGADGAIWFTERVANKIGRLQ